MSAEPTRAAPAPSSALAARLALLVAGALAGCGYSTGLRIPEEEGQTIGIEFFENLTPERDLERELHSELSRAAVKLVDAPLVDPDRSDLVVRGTLTRYQRRGGIRDQDNELLETGLRVEVRGSLWRRRRAGDPAPPPESPREERSKERVGYDHRRGLTYERDFSRPPSLTSFDASEWIELSSARASIPVGYVLGESTSEDEARDRALANVAERLVLDLLAGMN